VSAEYGAGLIRQHVGLRKETRVRFSYQGIDSKHTGTFDDYEVTACPERRNTTGVKCFSPIPAV